MEKLRKLGRKCPVCKKEVYGCRDTRKFCADKCKAKHHYISKLQLKDRVIGRSAFYKRNLYLLEGILGSKYSQFTIELEKLEFFKFRFDKYENNFKKDNIRTYKIENYEYYIDSDRYIHVKRNGEAPIFMEGFEERLLLEFPLITADNDNINVNLIQQKALALSSGNIWRE